LEKDVSLVTLVDKNCRIGNDVQMEVSTYDISTDYMHIKDGIVVIKKGAVIPNNFKIG
jgi:glucose-1-phosphate adenylyltransferase